VRRASLLLVLLATTGARAEDEAASIDTRSALDRPLMLPRWSVQAELGAGAGSSVDQSGVFSEVGLSVGLPLDFQLGFYWRQAFERDLNGPSQMAAALVNVQHAFTPWIGARLDVGSAASSAVTEPGLSLAVGIPFRHRFDDHFALISGETEGRGIGSLSGDGDWATFTPSEDLLTLREVSQPCFEAPFNNDSPPRPGGVPNFGGGCGGSGWMGTVGLPLGMLFQPRPGIAVSVRSGIRYAFSVDNSTSIGNLGPLPFFIPFAVRALWTPWRHLDLGLEVQAAGTPTTLGSNRSATVWTQVRL
jgi:hypothetical protein